MCVGEVGEVWILDIISFLLNIWFTYPFSSL